MSMKSYLDKDGVLSYPYADPRYEGSDVSKTFLKGVAAYRKFIEELPSEDVRENIHGNWIETLAGTMMCSACRSVFNVEYGLRFCPECGAVMDNIDEDVEEDIEEDAEDR